MQTSYYQATESPLPVYQSFEQRRPSNILIFCVAAVCTCVVAFITYDVSTKHFVPSAIPRAQTAMRPTAVIYAARNPFSFGKKEVEEAPRTSAGRNRGRSDVATTPLEKAGKITGVGAKVASELALYLAFNTAYFVTNTYEFLTKEEQKQLAKQTIDKQLPELLSLLGATTDTLGKTASTVAATPEYQELQKTAAEAAEELTKGLKTESTPTPEVIDKLKKIVADEKGEVLSDETKSALAETLKKGGIKGAELSLYVFYNVFSILRNLDRVLPTEQQTSSIEGKIEELESKVVDLVEQVKTLPSQTKNFAAKVEQLKDSIPTAEDLANVDPAEVSLSIRSGLASTKSKFDQLIAAIEKALEEDSELRKALKDITDKLKPATDALAALVAKLPLPKKADGSIDYSQLLAESGIITVKGLKALIEATKKAAGSVKAKTADN